MLACSSQYIARVLFGYRSKQAHYCDLARELWNVQTSLAARSLSHAPNDATCSWDEILKNIQELQLAAEMNRFKNIQALQPAAEIKYWKIFKHCNMQLRVKYWKIFKHCIMQLRWNIKNSQALQHAAEMKYWKILKHRNMQLSCNI